MVVIVVIIVPHSSIPELMEACFENARLDSLSLIWWDVTWQTTFEPLYYNSGIGKILLYTGYGNWC